MKCTIDRDTKELLAAIKRTAKEMKTNKKLVKELFKGSRIITKDGKLKREYWDLCIELGLV